MKVTSASWSWYTRTELFGEKNKAHIDRLLRIFTKLLPSSTHLENNATYWTYNLSQISWTVNIGCSRLSWRGYATNIRTCKRFDQSLYQRFVIVINIPTLWYTGLILKCSVSLNRWQTMRLLIIQVAHWLVKRHRLVLCLCHQSCSLSRAFPQLPCHGSPNCHILTLSPLYPILVSQWWVLWQPDYQLSRCRKAQHVLGNRYIPPRLCLKSSCMVATQWRAERGEQGSGLCNLGTFI